MVLLADSLQGGEASLVGLCLPVSKVALLLAQIYLYIMLLNEERSLLLAFNGHTIPLLMNRLSLTQLWN